MPPLHESDIEQMLIEQLKAKGYSYMYGPDIAPDSEHPMRYGFDEVVLRDKLESAVKRLNPSLPWLVQDEAIKTVLRIESPDLLANNEVFHRMLTEGIPVTITKDGVERGERVRLIDFSDPWNNDFVVVNQFTIIENGHNRRPDVILFVNGLPLVLFELKNAADENATLQSAFRQIETYKQQIPSLFTYNALVVISDGLEARAGSLSAGFSRFTAWKSDDGESIASSLVSELEVLVNGMLRKDTLLDIIGSFIVFEKQKQDDLKTGLTTIRTIKKIAAYHQYYAVNKAVESTVRATGVNQTAAVSESPANYGFKTVQQQEIGDHRAGVVWHTQGSGKSLTMVFYTGKIVQRLNNPTVVVITDRNDLDDQLFETFCGARQLLRQTPVQAESREHLKKLLAVQSGGVIFTTIQKFQPESGNVYDTLTNRSNVIVIADEAHRTQYGFKAKTVDVRNEADEVIGSEIKYGFAKYLRDALPNATYLGFTGTPIESTDVNTPAVFGNYIDVYDIAQAVEDGATVRIYYESRLAKVELSNEGRQLVEELDRELETENMNDVQKAKAKWTQLEALIGSPNRIKNIAKDIVTHFEERQKVFEGKAMIVAMSRRIAAELYNEIVSLRPEWHSDDLSKGAVKVVMTSSASDGADIAKHHTTKEQRRILAERMKDPDDELKLVIVRDMWLTGFDAPCLHTLYIDKPMQGHNLMQAIARVNRVYKDKPGGLVVDYLGIAADLKKALSFYSDSGGKGDPTMQQEQAVALMQEKIEVVEQMFFGFDYKQYFTADTSGKLSWILKAEDFILSLDDGKKRFVNEVTALGKAFALAIPQDAAMDVKDEVAF
ncbi:MAG: type I restriction endonuclease subunit R, partial [Salinivirgaceae bacterium]|nr:type I restriction endonuclease subunit R [Salinivirgaceae bacterium]